MIQLHCFCQSGNAFKVAFLLRALNLPWQPVFVDFMNGITRTSEWRDSHNAMGEVPVLIDGDRRLTQSGVILTYLADKHGQFGGKSNDPKSEDEKLEVLRWLLFDNHKFTSYFATHRFMKSFGPSAPDAAVMAWLRTRLDNAFNIVDKHLAGRTFMAGHAPTIADISLSGYLFYPESETGYPITGKYPNIEAWLDRLRAIPGWGNPYDVMPGERIEPKW